MTPRRLTILMFIVLFAGGALCALGLSGGTALTAVVPSKSTRHGRDANEWRWRHGQPTHWRAFLMQR